MSTMSYQDELNDVKVQAESDLLDALEAASKRLRESVAIESVVGIREAAEAMVSVDDAMRRFAT